MGLDIQSGALNVPHATQLHALNSLHRIHRGQGNYARFVKYDPAETTLLPDLEIGEPVGLKNANVLLATADLSDSKKNKLVGALMAIPTAASPFVFVLCKGRGSDHSVSLATDTNLVDGAAIDWAADRVFGIAAAAGESQGVAEADDAAAVLASFYLDTTYGG